MLRAKPSLKYRLRGEMHRRSFIEPSQTKLTNKDALFYGMYHMAQLHVWSKVAKRHLWTNLQFPVGRLMEDMATTPRLLLNAKSYFYCPEVWVAYRQRPGSILRTPSVKLITDSSQANDGVLTEWLKQHPDLSERSRFAFCHFCAKSLIGAARHLRQHGQAQLIPEHLRWFLHNTQIAPRWLLWQYLKRGWWLRALRFWLYVTKWA